MKAYSLGAAGAFLLAPLVLVPACKADPEVPPATGGNGTTVTTTGTSAGGSTGAGGQGAGGGATGGSGGASAGGAGTGGGLADAGAPPTPTCQEYCKYVTLNCHDINAMYKDEGACLKACAAFPVGKSEDATGNTLGCRLNHAHAALAMPAGECTAAGPGGDGICGTNCDGFCEIALKFCPAVWPDGKACHADCDNFPADVWYSANVISGDSFACRMFYATMAAEDTLFCDDIKKASAVCTAN